MLKFLKRYQDAVLIVCALALLGLIVWYFVWGTGVLVVSLNQAANPEVRPVSVQSEFSLEAAKNILKARGKLE